MMKLFFSMKKFPYCLQSCSPFSSGLLFCVRSTSWMVNNRILLRNSCKRRYKSLLILSNGSSIDFNIHITAMAKDKPEEFAEEYILPTFISPNNIDDHSENFRNTLFPHSTDTVISKLKSCYSLEDLLEVVNDKSSTFSSDHYIQLLLVLWDLMRYIEKDNVSKVRYSFESASKSILCENDVLTTTNLSNIIFDSVDNLSKNAEYLTPEVLVCTLLYSNRLGMPLTHHSNQNILRRINNLLEERITFPLPALSRLTIALVDCEELWSKLLMVKVLPYIYEDIDRCCNLEDFRALTITMLSSINYLREELLLKYETLTDKFIKSGIITENERSIIVKTLLLLNYVNYRHASRHVIHQLFDMLKNNTEKLFIPHVIDLQKVVHSNIEPYFLIRELQDFKEKYTDFVRKSRASYWDFNLVALPASDQGLELLKDHINKLNTVDSLLFLLHHITTAHVDICNMFWDKMSFLLTGSSTEEINVKILQRLSYRYFHFTNVMRIYCHRRFESQMLSLITTELVEGTASYNPKLLALFSTFVLAFDHRHRGSNSLSSDIVPRLINVMSQFDSVDCLLLSRGLKQGLFHQKTKELQLYLQLDAALNNRTRELMSLEFNSSGTIDKFNILFRTLINVKGSSDTNLFNFILKRMEHLDWNTLTSRSLKNLVYNLIITGSLVPAVMEKLVDYCLNNSRYITGDTAGKLAYLCYYMGYTPSRQDSFWDVIAGLVARDCMTMNGLTLLQIALALSFFNQLPSSLNNFIFTVDFLERLDEEIKNCFAKDKYPLRVRRTLMQLNRSLCLDHPEVNVPWFHTKFCEEQQALDRLDMKPKSLLYTDVLSSLTSILGGPNYLNSRVYSPYGYSIDIQINLDDALKPLKNKCSENVANRLAFLLLYSDNYTNYHRSLKGHFKMKKRHLEILGYKVICIADTDWNAMYMAEPKSKIEYLRNLIWPP